MHLKAYSIDGTLLRTGSANFSPSGLKQQDNDLIILRDPVAAAKFEERFDQDLLDGRPSSAATSSERNVFTCLIKGNINAKGECIYHEPGSRDYERVVMQDCDEHRKCAKGKRYFCSAAEAEEAGCRRPKR